MLNSSLTANSNLLLLTTTTTTTNDQQTQTNNSRSPRVPKKLNFIRKKKKKRKRIIEQLLGKSYFSIPFCIFIFILLASCMSIAIFTDYYEYVSFNFTQVSNKATYLNSYNNRTKYYVSELKNNNLYEIEKIDLTTKESIKFTLYSYYSGLWRLCNELNDDIRNEYNLSMCVFHSITNVFYDSSNDNESTSQVYLSLRHLIRMQNTAACCAVISYSLLILAFTTSILSFIKKYVPLALATSFLTYLTTIFLAFLISIMHAKIYKEKKKQNCYDVRIMIDMFCDTREIQFSYSLLFAWISLFLSFFTNILWYLMVKVQKKLNNSHSHFTGH